MKLICLTFWIFIVDGFGHSAPIADDYNDFFDSTRSQMQIPDVFGTECNSTCNSILLHTRCNESTQKCECEESYPVQLKRNKGCVKASSLGDQCLYTESCTYTDPYSVCVQMGHNAFCRCSEGYHESNQKLLRTNFCSQDIIKIATDLPTLFLVVGGVAVLSLLLCFTLKLFVGKSRRYENNTISTRLLSASEIAHMATSLRQSERSRSQSRRGSHGLTVSTSRATAARAAAILLVSCRIPPQDLTRKSLDLEDTDRNGTRVRKFNTDSPRSFSARQFKRETDQKLAAKNRTSQLNQQPSKSLEHFSSPKRKIQKRLQSTSMGNLSAGGANEKFEKTSKLAHSEELI